ncbi:hypothetical protein D3C80_1335510 [compost metagenome]
MRQIALQVHLAFFPVVRCWQGHYSKHAWANPLGQGLYGPALARTVTAFEDDADLDALGFDPLLQLDQLDMQMTQVFEVVLVLQFLALLRFAFLALGHANTSW